jgi:hypothetical protein
MVAPSGHLYGSEFCLLDILEYLDRTFFSPEVILPISSPLTKQLEKLGVPFFEMLMQNGHEQPRLHKLPSYPQSQSNSAFPSCVKYRHSRTRAG